MRGKELKGKISVWYNSFLVALDIQYLMFLSPFHKE